MTRRRPMSRLRFDEVEGRRLRRKRVETARQQKRRRKASQRALRGLSIPVPRDELGPIGTPRDRK